MHKGRGYLKAQAKIKDFKQSDAFAKFAEATPEKRKEMLAVVNKQIKDYEVGADFDPQKAMMLRELIQTRKLMMENRNGSRFFDYSTTGPSLRRHRNYKEPKKKRYSFRGKYIGVDKHGNGVFISRSKFEQQQLEAEGIRDGIEKKDLKGMLNDMTTFFHYLKPKRKKRV